MPVIQRSRFSNWLKNLTGFRGPFGLSLDGGIAPVYDFSSEQPELDDEVARWYFEFSLAAVAAQFSTLQIKLASGLPLNTRAVVDGVLVRAQVAAQSYHVGISQEIAGAGGPTALSNNFLGVRTGVFSVAQVSLGAVLNISRQNAASIFATGLASVDTLANGADVILDRRTYSLFPFIVTPGYAFSVETSAVNQPIAAVITGRFYGDQL